MYAWFTFNADLEEVIAQDVRGLSKEAFGCMYLLHNILQAVSQRSTLDGYTG